MHPEKRLTIKNQWLQFLSLVYNVGAFTTDVLIVTFL